MAKITGFGDAFRTLAAESGTMRGHPMMATSMHYACESDEQAAVLQADAAQDAADMVADIEVADTSGALASQAEQAGDVFAAAATDESVPEGSIAQADGVAMDIADETGMEVQQLLPDITDADRVAQVPASESANGRVTFRPMYGRIRGNKAGLQRCAESMWTAAKSLVGNAWDSIVKAFRKFCQWVDKYIGTFPRLKMKVESLLKDAKNLDGKKIKSGENKIDVNSGSKNLAKPALASSDVTYITKGGELISTVTEIRKVIAEVIELQRDQEEGITDFIDAVNGADFSDERAAGATFDAVEKASESYFNQFVAKAGNTHMADHDTAYAKAYSTAVLPGYQRVLFMVPSELKTKINGAETAIEAIEGMTDKLSGLDCKIVDGDPKLKKTIKETVQFETMSAGQVEELANELKKGLEEIIAYRSSKQFLKNEASVRRLKDSVEKMSSRSTNAPDDDNTKHSRAVNKATVAMARAAMRLLGIPTRSITFYDTYTNFFFVNVYLFYSNYSN
jgi:hypothetical protein